MATRPRPSDQGSASVQLALVLPVFMMMLMLIIQFALYYHAEHIAAAAAAQAAATAGVDGGSSDDGRAEAERILHDTASGFLLKPTVAVERDGRHVVVRIGGQVMSLVPFLHLTASSVARCPIESLTRTVS